MFLLLALQAAACPFCNPSSSDLYTITSNSKVVARVEKIGNGKFKILELLKGEAKIGRVVLAGEGRDIGTSAPYLLVSTISNPNQPYWSDPVRPLTAQEYQFFKTALKLSSEAKLFDLAAKYVGSQSELISESAYSILANAPLAEVQRRGPMVGRAKLVEWLKSPSTSSSRRSLYLLMLIPSLTPADKGWLQKQALDQALSPYADHLPPLMAAYAEVAGPTGVEDLRQRWLKPTTSSSASFGATSGFVFIGNYSKNPATKQAARKLFQRELKHPERGVFAISILGEWRDFSVAEEVETLAFQNAETPWVVTSATRYFRSFENEKAHAALKRLQTRFPKIVEAADKPYPKL